jgi:hypothetical protein
MAMPSQDSGQERKKVKREELAVRDTTFEGGGSRYYISGFEDFQAVTARPSGRGNAYDRR